MGLLRSEEMSYGLLVLPVQDARRYIEKIGKSTSIQFDDMNAREMRRPYRKHIQRIDEMERILRFLLEEIGKLENTEIIKNKMDEFLAMDSSYKLDNVEVDLQLLYSNFVKFKENNMSLVSERNSAVEEREVISAAMQILGGAGSAMSVGDEDALRRPILEDDALGGRRLGYVAGVVTKADQQRFERALWRTSRGNVFVQFSPIREKVIDPKTAQAVEKSVFVVYFQGSEGAMKDKIVKVCTAFGVNLYAWPANSDVARQREGVLKRQLEDKDAALQAYQRFLTNEARDLVSPSPGNAGGNSKIEDWRLFCVKEKAIYNVLNMCEEGMILRVNVWYPSTEEDKIKLVLKEESAKSPDSSGAVLNPDRAPKHSLPPTYIRTNEFTEAWQEVVDTYGVPRYQEANPALFATVTFPFIFGMMYGDVGHGTMLLLAGVYLVQNGESFRYTQPTLFMARYMLLQLGIFAVFAGFMYNDFFSIGLPIFESGFVDTDGDGVFEPTYDVRNEGGPGPYPFGLDWAWVGASNELLYVNSMKMKLSVLFGVLQMILGLLLRWGNAIYEKNKTDFIFECVPMMVFMLCFFGWMDVMILYKWVHPIDNAPNIINSLICMAMGQEDDNPLWPGSVELAQKFMLCTVVSVPFMLFPKPFILLAMHNREAKKGEAHQLLEDEESHPMAAGTGHGHGEEFEFGEIFIHQIIETIEYVLGTVSHTASYLRVWALSLAHQQLSLVFFQKTLTMGLEMSFPANGIMLYFMFAAWFGITLGVLLGMDVLECFLHTLRLHWVEFQSKFYKAGGEKFAPFEVRKMLVESSAD